MAPGGNYYLPGGGEPGVTRQEGAVMTDELRKAKDRIRRLEEARGGAK